MGQLSTSFSDSTYSASNKPSVATLKADIQAIETAHNDTDSNAAKLTEAQTLTNKILTSPVINTQITGTAIVDEDNMASDSAFKVPTQQSVKAYVDSGAVTMTNKTLTSPVLNGTLTGTGGFNAWATWTPSWTNLTVGNGTQVAKYVQIGKTVHCRLSLIFGSTTVITGTGVFCGFPVTPVSYTQYTPVGIAILNCNASTFNGSIAFINTSGFEIWCHVTNDTYAYPSGISSTIPSTWTTGNSILITGTYEAA